MDDYDGLEENKRQNHRIVIGVEPILSVLFFTRFICKCPRVTGNAKFYVRKHLANSSWFI